MKDRALASGEFGFDRSDFAFIATTLYEDAGISLPASKANLVYSRLAKRLRALGLESFRDYCELVGSDEGSEERTQMIAALTTNVTRFFREPHHFDHLRRKVVEPAAAEIRQGRRLRIWSAGCSSGQEPYSIALTLLSVIPDARAYDVRILATDINPIVLEQARKATYPAEEVVSVPADMRKSWMEPTGIGTLRLDEAPRGLVSFRPLNLIGSWPMKGPFDAVFCRNVVIYFDEKTQMRLLTRLSSLLRPGGYLYLGHSERMVGPAEALFRLEGTTTYRKLGGDHA
ncbi:chemotaxis protein [Aestuariivirga litoralis]|uniref:Chemotaxis protein methyltransferase n=1 Tax=Aestuariivirga litoralis TaxID=2650924 RepID=A0A2W2BSZ2_9HYPH|nr:protein-glutamate O-methyltransferase CheR [Aestuariivirga litoralis]PZF76566.1 chemotaxis protein [Aestuariivirga litoralis]